MSARVCADPLSGGAFLILTGGVAELEAAVFTRPVAAMLFTAEVWAAAFIVRVRALKQPPISPDPHALSAGEVLSLN
jgi:hypothetical protein